MHCLQLVTVVIFKLVKLPQTKCIHNKSIKHYHEQELISDHFISILHEVIKLI